MRWQFEPGAPGGVLPGLLEVIQNLHLSPGGVAFWLLKPTEHLGGATPLDLLQQHQPARVVQRAWEHGFMPGEAPPRPVRSALRNLAPVPSPIALPPTGRGERV